MGSLSENIETFRLEDAPGVIAPGDGVTVHWHRPAREGPRSRRGIVVLPIQGGDYEVSTLFARYFASRGYSCLRFERRAEWLDSQRDPSLLGPLIEQYVADVRRGIGRWREDAGVEPELGLFGVSMGAMVGTVVAAQEPAIGPAVLPLGGGPLAAVLATADDTEVNRFRAELATRLDRREGELLPHFRDALDGWDPLLHAGDLDPNRVLLISARFDRVVRYRLQTRLWDAMGRPRRVTLPCGHYSSILFVPWIKWASVRWFDRYFGIR